MMVHGLTGAIYCPQAPGHQKVTDVQMARHEPCETRIIDVGGSPGSSAVAMEDAVAKPVIYADEVAKIIQSVHEQRKLQATTAAVDYSFDRLTATQALC
jgi:hypothetical protein